MSPPDNTLFLRLSGPMQSWGTNSRLQLRRTDGYPSKSGVLGILLCAMGVGREDAAAALETLAPLEMGVRVDRPGVLDWDYHTAGAGAGIRQAKGGVKFTASTHEPETLLSRRQYILDASFLVALCGEPETIRQVAAAMQDPKWPVYLGRKCCVPTEPVFAGVGHHPEAKSALASQPWYGGGESNEEGVKTLDAYIEHRPGKQPPATALLVYDVPRTLKNPSHGPRWVIPDQVQAAVVASPAIRSVAVQRRSVNYASPQWKETRARRLEMDNGLCVFCKSPAQEVHHVTYENVGSEKMEDLRSVCTNCHDACTQLEYGRDLRLHRIDPADAGQREVILRQVQKLLSERRIGRRRAVGELSRSSAVDFLTDTPGLKREKN